MESLIPTVCARGKDMIYKGDALEYIESTPGILLTILDDRVQILRKSMEMLREKPVSAIYLAGSGSSYHAAVAAAPFLKKMLGVRVFPVHPAAFLGEEALWTGESLVLGISQQGTSMSVFRFRHWGVSYGNCQACGCQYLCGVWCGGCRGNNKGIHCHGVYVDVVGNQSCKRAGETFGKGEPSLFG